MAVELRKRQKISLEKKGVSLGEIHINLNWTQNTKKKFFNLFTVQKNIDLDLGCLYELKDGTKGSIQALGNNFGSFDNKPYIILDGDDRSGLNEDGENLRINGNKISEIKRILVYTFIYEGIANWREANGVITIKCPGNEDIIIRMDEYNTRQTMCAIAMITNQDDKAFSVEKYVEFFSGHQYMDGHFNWGLNWVYGRK